MTNHVDEYRARLLGSVERIRAIERQKAAEEEARQMTDAQLLEVICSSLGLPPGTTFTEEQLWMIANHR